MKTFQDYRQALKAAKRALDRGWDTEDDPDPSQPVERDDEGKLPSLTIRYSLDERQT